jgi:glucose/arabinose dehydrogenase
VTRVLRLALAAALCGILIAETGFVFSLEIAPGRAVGQRSDQTETAVHLPLVTTRKPAPQFNTRRVATSFEPRMTDIEPLGDGRLFIVAKSGIIRLVDQDGTVSALPFLDIRDRVVSLHNEQGLFAITLHPQFPTNGFFYVAYTREDLAPNAWTLVISRFQVLPAEGASSLRPRIEDLRADLASEHIVLEIPKGAQFHNGGSLRFGPQDGYLYIGVGDDARPLAAQDGSELVGKILRIDVDSADPYAIPADNPFVDDPMIRGEIWAMGLRNPWRVRFDSGSGDVYIADVGEASWEEIDFQSHASGGGQNYGWPCHEGHAVYSKDACEDAVAYTPPVYVYQHIDDRCSITGGEVYKGQLFPAWRGRFLFGDFCTGEVFSLSQDDQHRWRADWLGAVPWLLATFGQDSSGEIYAGGFNSADLVALVPAP